MERNDAFELLGMEKRNGALTVAQIAKVKGMGCLRDKRYDDVFNVRFITRNGTITTGERRTIAQAADLFKMQHPSLLLLKMCKKNKKRNNCPSLLYI